MVIFHSYVSLPEGTTTTMVRREQQQQQEEQQGTQRIKTPWGLNLK